MQNQNMGGGNYRQQPPQQQFQPEDEDDDKFERKGDFYQCVKCEEYTVHIKNDKYCENPKCPSNAKSQYMQKSTKQTPHRGSVFVPTPPNKTVVYNSSSTAGGKSSGPKKYVTKAYCQNCNTTLQYKNNTELK